MNLTTYSTSAPPLTLGANNPFFDMYAKIGEVYSESMKTDAGQLWTSSARIIQEHSAQAVMNASQNCLAALAQNAATIQQQSMARIGAANQKAFEIMAGAFAQSMQSGFKPAR